MWQEIKDKSILVFDAETDGLLETVENVHCVIGTDANSRETYESKGEFLQELDKYEVLAGHNIIGYDLPMLKLMYDWEPKAHVIILDTLWMSRMYWPDLEGGHSLGAWGERLGNPKTEYYPVIDPDQPVYNLGIADPSKYPCWEGSIWTQMMHDYCKQDVNVNVDVFWKLVKLLENFTWESIECEMKVATLIQRQMTHGFVFDFEGAEKLHATLLERKFELEDEVHRTFKPLPKLIRVVQPKVKMDDTVSSVGLKQIDNWESIIPVPEFTRSERTEETKVFNEFTEEWNVKTKVIKDIEYHSGSFSLIEWPEFSLGSRQQIAERLTRAGYKLTKMTEKGNPIIDDIVLQEADEAGIPEAKPLAEYFLITKREGMVKDWLAKARWHEDQGVYRIHGYVNSMGANSHRMTHSAPNVAQVPAAKSPYGKECRSLFGVRKGYKLVGCDASGLELRTLAHYMNDAVYTKELLEGDIHTANQIAAGLPTRDNAKTFIL